MYIVYAIEVCGVPVYIGVTTDVLKRHKAHRLRWPTSTVVPMLAFKSKSTAYKWERRCIVYFAEQACPLQNIAHYASLAMQKVPIDPLTAERKNAKRAEELAAMWIKRLAHI